MVFASGVSTDCLVTGCGELAVADGLCRSHYNRKAYSGRPVTPIRARVCSDVRYGVPIDPMLEDFLFPYLSQAVSTVSGEAPVYDVGQ